MSPGLSTHHGLYPPSFCPPRSPLCSPQVSSRQSSLPSSCRCPQPSGPPSQTRTWTGLCSGHKASFVGCPGCVQPETPLTPASPHLFPFNLPHLPARIMLSCNQRGWLALSHSQVRAFLTLPPSSQMPATPHALRLPGPYSLPKAPGLC